MDEAPCCGLGDLFFPDVDDDGVEIGSTSEARAICAVCPFQIECADFAITTKQEYGIFGGMDYKERQSLKSAVYRQTKRPVFTDALNEVLVGLG
jgi:WhiB family transcriptional regulator, redox-sensing transcriptional regulator